MCALLADNLKAAGAESGIELTDYFVSYESLWLWRFRAEQIRRDPASAGWVARAAVDQVFGLAVGHAGFHGPPDDRGMVEVGYSVDPRYRRQGYAKAMLRTLRERARAQSQVRTVRASISLDNAASLATIRGFGFSGIGEQRDEELRPGADLRTPGLSRPTFAVIRTNFGHDQMCFGFRRAAGRADLADRCQRRPMVNIGYTLMCEQTGPRQLVRDAAAAEQAGFGLAVISDHISPWLDAQGHSPNAWGVLGAVSQVTDQIELMTYVTCPTGRYHPVVVAQQAATIGLLSDGRFTLGLGSGENLNEHVIGRGWPAANERHERLEEALDIINALFDGGYVNYVGRHYRVDSAKIWDLPQTRVPIGVAVSGAQSIKAFAARAEVMIAIEPDPELGPAWDKATAASTPARKVGQFPVSWDADVEAAKTRAHNQFRWFAGGWKVNAELPSTAGFDAASQFVTPDAVAAQIPCGTDIDAVVKAVKPFKEAGFTDLALVQIGADRQQTFLEAAEKELLPALREALK